jgi:hypothetical protein
VLLLLLVAGCLVGSGTPSSPYTQRSWCGKLLQDLPPEHLSLRQILLLQPRNVVPVWTAHCEMQLPAGTKCLVQLKNFFKQQRLGPPVQEQVVVGPQQLVDIFSHLDQGESHQRGFGKYTALRTVRGEERLETFLLLARAQIPPVIVLPWDLDTPVNHLKWLSPVFPVEGSTQDWVTFHHTPPGLL